MAKRTIPPEPRSAQAFSANNTLQVPYFRKLKVRKGCYFPPVNPHRPYRRPAPVPWVQIKGYWLNQAGFTIGTALSVQVQPGCIILKTLPSSSE